MRPNNLPYTIQITRQFQNESFEPTFRSINQKRILSVQKIRINSKGLPSDFFTPFLSKKKLAKNQSKHTNFNKISEEKQQSRITPRFRDQSLGQRYQPRQYKSEERMHGMNAKDTYFSQRHRKIEKQYTFSRSFFDQEDKRLQRLSNKYHNGNKGIKKDVWQQSGGMSIFQKKQLSELDSKKYIGSLNLHQNRVIPPKPKNTLPLLKARFPSVFGT